MKERIQQVLSPEHTQGIPGKKASSKTLKSDDFVETGRRLVGDGFALNEDKPAAKMPGGRLKGGSSTFHKDHKDYKEHKDTKDHKDYKDHKESKDARDTKDLKEQKEHKDYNHNKPLEEVDTKVLESTENHVKEDEVEGQKRRAQDGERETLLQWGQRKRPRYSSREPPNGTLKTSIRADRRVVRADKQNAAQPAVHIRANSVRPSTITTQEPASGSGKRIAEGVSGSAAANIDHNHGQTSTGHLRSSAAEKDDSRNHQVLTENADKASACPASTSGVNGCNSAPPISTHGRQENEPFQEKVQPAEKTNMDFFEWPKILLGLTRKEKEDDFMAIKGTKLPQRPKRRPKAVEKNVNFISPGTWLCDLTRERYEVREKKAVKKKPRGLKAMGSVDSDSE